MLRVSLIWFNYHRILAEKITSTDTIELKKEYDYSFIVCYGKFNDPDYEVTNKNACIIDLRGGIDSVFSKFSSTSRNEVRRSDKILGLIWHCGIRDFDFAEYYAFHQRCEQDRNWIPVPPDELKNSIVFSVTYNGNLISGISCYEHGNRIRVGRIYSTRRSNRLDNRTNFVYGCASKRLVFEICNYAIEKGYSTLDLGGVDLIDPNKIGISRFKMSLGGKVVPVIIARWGNNKYFEHKEIVRSKGWDIT